MKFSIVIPVHNEADNIAPLHAEILAAMRSDIFEVIYVNDGSTDDTERVLRELDGTSVISLPERRGQTAAMAAGFLQARGEYVITLDGDGQNDPADIALLYAHMRSSGADCVSGWRKDRKDSFVRRFSAALAFFARRLLIGDGIRDSGSTFKIYDRRCLEGLEFQDGMHRFMPAILKLNGFRVEEIPVQHRPRRYGASKYGSFGLTRIPKGLLDLLRIAAAKEEWVLRKTKHE